MDDKTKKDIEAAAQNGLSEQDIMGMAESGAPEEEVQYALSLIKGEADNQKPNEDSVKQQYGAEDNEIVERFVTGVMTMASGKGHDQMIAMAKSAKGNNAEGFGRALFFILKGVKSALEGKGVEIPAKLWLAERNGLIEQTAKIVAILLNNAGVQLSPEDVQQGMSLAAETLGMDAESPQGEQQEAMPQQAPPQAPQGGMIEQGMQQPMPQPIPQGMPQ